MAILQKTKPMVFFTDNSGESSVLKLSINLQLVYDAIETPWEQVCVKFYTITGEALDKATINTTASNTGVISVNQVYTAFTPADGTTGLTQFFVEVAKMSKENVVASTNKRVIVAVTKPVVTITTEVQGVQKPNIDFDNKTFIFTFTPSTLADGRIDNLAKYRLSIIPEDEEYESEIGQWIFATGTGKQTIVCNYDLNLVPSDENAPINYTVKIDYETSMGYTPPENEIPSVSVIKNKCNYINKGWLVPIKPELCINDIYGFVKITMPKEIIKYNHSVSGTGNPIITIQNCYGCGGVVNIYTSLALNKTVGCKSATSDTNINRTIVATADVTNTACVGFYPQGKYRLLKEIEYENFKELDIIDCSNYSDSNPYEYYDYNIEQGFEYKYYLIPYTDNTSIGAKPATIKPQWDSILLSDAHGRILTIQYNPQVSSFKTTLQEQKQDTLSGQYPFFLRNGDTYYKEIPLSGLISYHADPLNKFGVAGLPGADNLTRLSSHADRNAHLALLEQDEYYLERIYKREVESWLNNGEPKLLRTAAEGNFIVRLMNVSLSPNQQLGRRMHTFNATAYEIADYTMHNLRQYGLDCLNTNHTQGNNEKWQLNGTVNSTMASILVDDLPVGLNSSNAYKLNINEKLNISIQKIILNAEDVSGNVMFIFNGKMYTVEGGTTLELQPNINSTISCFIIGTEESTTDAYIELEYEKVTLST